MKSACFTVIVLAMSLALPRLSKAADAAPEWKVGVATVAITPGQPMWMAGYASRTKPSDGVLSELHAKALVIEDSAGTRAVIVTTDLIGIPRPLRLQVARAAEDQYNVNPAGLLLNCSHTHCSPVVRDDLEMSVMYPLDAEQRRRVESYFVELRDKLIGVIGLAVEDLKPARISYSHARSSVAMNRRLPTKDGYQNSPYPDGPVDHDVPVLRVESPDGKLRAIAFGYACHNTTTGVLQFNADYAGYAQTELEKAHPGATALFVMGCGGDQNPYPRGQIEWAMTHGKNLATAVEAALLPQPLPLHGPLKFELKEIDLPFEPVTREELVAKQESKDIFEKRRVEALLAEYSKNGQVRASYPYPVQTLQFGGDLTLITLGGEVVIDYALRLKREFGSSAVWVAGYSNDVMAYIPSERILKEGGYEGGGAMRYTNLPGPWRPGVEDLIVDTVRDQVTRLRQR
ncbi:MAG: neutral/alkaline non-lysosomal ceramidase N-terminal domain-containing protein [Planctomycetes bacterium]|nr:neutral/alkaline non-lysosomal ceramidase N-terminal domain-containing protein [Planctomycetota bacterium]